MHLGSALEWIVNVIQKLMPRFHFFHPHIKAVILGCVLRAASWLAVWTLLTQFSVAAATTDPIGLNAILREAVTPHADIRSRPDDQQAAFDRLDAARCGRFPGLGAELETRSGEPQSVLCLEQPVWNGGRICSEIDVSQAELSVAGAALSEIELDVPQRSTGAFFGILRLESRLQPALASEAEHLRLVEIIQRRVAAEVSPSTDDTQAAPRWHQVITERIQTKLQIETVSLLLAQLVGKAVHDLLPPNPIQMHRWSEAAMPEEAMRVFPRAAAFGRAANIK